MRLVNQGCRRGEWPLAAFVASIALVGCGRGASGGAGAVDYSSMRAKGDLYGLYLDEHQGQAPKDEQAFRDFLAGKQDLLDRAGLEVDQVFTAPRGGALAWVYGQRPPKGGEGKTYFAYETTLVDGKRMVFATRGMHEELDDAQFHKIFPKVR